MRMVALLLIIVGVSGCGKSDAVEPALTSIDGNWTYATPDGTIKVDFKLTLSNMDVLSISNSKIVVSNTPGEAAGQLTMVDLPSIETIRINANDPALVQPYSITFRECSVASDFKRILVTSAEYTYPWGTVKTLSNITITRKS
ncbi:MAG: hypothetical protein SH819_01645 [Cytophagales bacterium]|nr:hypothetical protein [Cytophagales bacterium]